MIKISDVIERMQQFAPLETAQTWDNSGWQINLGYEETENIMLCLSVTPQVLQQAKEHNCNFIISHHPLIFNGFKKIEANSVVQKTIIDAIKSDIQIYSAHTNLDIAEGGVNDVLCEKLGLAPLETRFDFVKICEMEEEMPLDSFILKLKISLNCPKIKLINPTHINTSIRKVALCSGAGGEFINKIKDVDIFITGDIKYHSAIEVENMVLIDAGHFETEKIVLQSVKNILHEFSENIVIAKEQEPWVIV